jgi:hypothetical protein
MTRSRGGTRYHVGVQRPRGVPHAAILYLKACGHEELSTTILWPGADLPAKA